jgi:hypothetical protein
MGDRALDLWRGYRWKHGPFPRPEVDHDHCPECNTTLAWNERARDFCYYFLEDWSEFYAGSNLNEFPDLDTEEQRQAFLLEPVAFCTRCFERLADLYNWTVVAESDCAPVYPLLSP